MFFNDSFFDPFPGTLLSGLDHPLRNLGKSINRRFRDIGQMLDWNPTADIVETNDAYVINAEMPGVPKDQIKISLDHNILTLSGERKSERKEDDENNRYHRLERSFGSFVRSFVLPDDVDQSKGIKANYSDGVLKVNLPKVVKNEASKAQEIPIE